MRTAALAIAVSLMTLSGAAVVAAQTPLGNEAVDLHAHTASALETVRAYCQAWNSHDPRALGVNGVTQTCRQPSRPRGRGVVEYEAVILVVRRDDVWKVQPYRRWGIDMSETFDFVVVGGGSAGAVIAARLSEDPSCRVALIEAGERPPAEELMPVACPAMQLNPATDWMYTADPGNCGLGLDGRRMMMPRGKMLGGSSGINYMAYVRGHPGDFDAWAEGGATGWSYARRAAVLQEERGARAERRHPD